MKSDSPSASGRKNGLIIHPLHWEDVDAVAEMLTHAFADDPLVHAICTAPARRRNTQILWNFRMATRAHALSPQPAWILSTPAVHTLGVVLVSQPSMRLQALPDIWFTVRGLFHIGWECARRGIEAAKQIAAHAPPPPFTYVRTLGIEVESQRRGYGSRLLQHAIAQACEEWPVYLETAKRQNIDFYQQNGFECIGEFTCLGVSIWRMLRKPTGDGPPVLQGKP